MYNIEDIKQNLENEADFIFNHVDDPEVIEALERMRVSYYIYYNMLRELAED